MEYKVRFKCQQVKQLSLLSFVHHIKSDAYIFKETETSLLKLIIHYLLDSYDELKYLTIKNKLINNLKLSHQEIQFLILSPFMVQKKLKLLKIKDVCDLIKEIKEKRLFDSDEMYLPLILAINQYVSDDDERKKLIKVVTMYVC